MSDVVTSSALVPVMLDARAMEVVRDQLAPNAPAGDLQWFAYVAEHLGLDPFRGQIVLIGRYDKRAQRDVYRPQITVDGRRAIAARTGELVGIEGPWWAGPRNAAGELEWLDVWTGPGTPYVARVLVYRKGWVKPANGTAKWSEMAQTGPLWQSMPAHMLAKVAESMALRRAFPETVGSAIVSVEGDDMDTPDAVLAPSTVVDGAAGVAREVGTMEPSPEPRPAPPPRDEYVVPTPEQYAEIKTLRAALGLEDAAVRDVWLRVVSEALGWPVTDTRQLDRSDAAALIVELRTHVEQAPNDEVDEPYPPEPEPEPDTEGEPDGIER